MRYSIPLLFLLLILSCSSKIQKEEVEVKPNSLQEEIIEDEVLVSYDDLKADSSNKRNDFRKLYNSCNGNKVNQDSIIIDAQEYLLNISDQYFKAWYGTPWAFHGHSKVPSEPLIGRNPLNDSKYRVIGKIMDKEMVRNWILNTPYSE
ncbi:hypothetical protein [Dysgonomonas sp. ZJ279]|uniref:hypothetical protein n=1 Tax=Dysgonomonas sp. ZJ279 TaxID=2709796 RepID=UPI0013EDC5E7|nr:hypothetical protein [Dysgonomonas sp. ZJ279]